MCVSLKWEVICGLYQQPLLPLNLLYVLITLHISFRKLLTLSELLCYNMVYNAVIRLNILFQGLQSIFDQEMLSFLDELYSMTDEYTDRWLSSGILSLRILM